MKELNNLLDKGMISQQTFQRAATDAEDKLNKALGKDAEKTLKINVEIGDNELLRFGSQQFRQLARGLLPGDPAGNVPGLPGAINPAFADLARPVNPNAPGGNRAADKNTDSLTKIATNTANTVTEIRKLKVGGLQPANLSEG